MAFLRKNFAQGYLSVGIDDDDVTITLLAGHTLPTSAGNMRLIIWNSGAYPNPSDDPDKEIVTAVYVSGNNYSITRAQESTSAVAHIANSMVALHFTAAMGDEWDAAVLYDYSDISANDAATDVTGAELEELTDGSETTLHSHSYVDFVDRGNLTAVDFDLGDLTADGNWHNLDLSGIVPAGAKAVKLRVSVNCTNYTTNNYIKFRKNGNTDSSYNVQLWKAFVNNLVITTEVFVFCDTSRIIEYAIINTLTQCDIIVCGWII